jgi:NAD(P)-dependent dehydrogenase (short-subunit alcohol dehydrogenase family)
MGESKRIAVITGAAQGIGRRIAELLAERGYELALIDLRSTANTLEAARSFGADAMEFSGDISDEPTVLCFAGEVHKFRGCVEVLVNHAGMVTR